jgi:hypothetical protein
VIDVTVGSPALQSVATTTDKTTIIIADKFFIALPSFRMLSQNR